MNPAKVNHVKSHVKLKTQSIYAVLFYEFSFNAWFG